MTDWKALCIELTETLGRICACGACPSELVAKATKAIEEDSKPDPNLLHLYSEK